MTKDGPLPTGTFPTVTTPTLLARRRSALGKARGDFPTPASAGAAPTEPALCAESSSERLLFWCPAVARAWHSLCGDDALALPDALKFPSQNRRTAVQMAHSPSVLPLSMFKKSSVLWTTSSGLVARAVRQPRTSVHADDLEHLAGGEGDEAPPMPRRQAAMPARMAEQARPMPCVCERLRMNAHRLLSSATARLAKRPLLARLCRGG